MSHSSHNHSDVLVVGGGAVGLACAYYLVRSGRSVRIIDQETVGAGASHGNCGIIFVSDLPPLCVPGAVRHELMRTLRGTSPLYIKPRPDPGLGIWLLRFAAHCNPGHRARAIRVRDSLLRLSHRLLRSLISDEHLDCEYDQRGVLMAFTDPEILAGYAATNRLLAPFGRAGAFYDRRAVHNLEPALGERVCGGWYHPSDGHLRPERFMESWCRAARARGVVITEHHQLERFEGRNASVRAVRTRQGGRFTADRFVLAAGTGSPAIARQLGIRIPVQPGKGYSITMARPAVCPAIPCYLYECNVVVTPWQSGYRLGGTMEFSGFDDTLNERRLATIERSAAGYLKTPLGRPVTERWAGHRPMSVDDLPIIDRMPHIHNLYVATGHGMLGISMATGTGRLIADMLLGQTPPIDPRPFSIRRFGRQY
ncbi:MAG: FAD-dependent oxidoreductase [Deltaproteobacteria bacterium]|nr:FAD-dependent oxidoreductase [Deltaproteobacteria bacterium]